MLLSRAEAEAQPSPQAGELGLRAASVGTITSTGTTNIHITSTISIIISSIISITIIMSSSCSYYCYYT